MLLDRAKIPASITTHEQLITWAALAIRFNTTTLTFVRQANEEPTRLADVGIFRDAAGDDRVGILVYPSLNANWQNSATKIWTQANPLSTSAQAAAFDS
ncbi:hypothetical protein H6F41_16690 [Pseudanabaena sp. FACHB-723]|uniref:Uncharacterized protein n=2 Tax=Pseudanabaena mucicola TaxID=71190 RepID=A0ABR8A0L4_9CYAN|nr:hypothetical protein [Pseudanabaena mucicola FACHB-723]